jgi:hypothetical protein
MSLEDLEKIGMGLLKMGDIKQMGIENLKREQYDRMCAILSHYCVETGISEDAVETLLRKLKELEELEELERYKRQYIVKSLEESILYHRGLYYNGMPSISDKVYDELVEKLRNIHPKSKVLNSWPKTIELSLCSDRCDTRYYARLVNCPEDAVQNFTYALSEVSFTLSINENGSYTIDKIRDNGKTYKLTQIEEQKT